MMKQSDKRRDSACSHVRPVRGAWLTMLIMFVFSFFTFSPLRAEKRVKRLWMKADSILASRYYRTRYDTNYVVRPEGGRLTLKLKGNFTGNSIRAKGTVQGVSFNSSMKTDYKATIGIAAAYRGLSASFSINPAKMKGTYSDYELNINYYARRFAINASYQRSSSLSGDMNFSETTRPMLSGDSKLHLFNVTGYYIFNHRRYSAASAYTQSYIQRRSAGSWIAGLSYQGGNVKASNALMERSPDAPNVRIYFGHIGIGGGYGYNLVLGKRWLFNLTLLPTFVVYNRNRLTINGESQQVSRMRFNMLFNERAAIVFNISPRYFLGINAVTSNSLFVDKALTVHQNKWNANAFVGMRLWK